MRREYFRYKEQARELIVARLGYFSALYQIPVGRVAIRNQKTRWGSCSRKGNLNFNYKLLFLPLRSVDYVVVHELCHLKEFNHSRRFWQLVGQTIPDYKQRRRELKQRSLSAILQILF